MIRTDMIESPLWCIMFSPRRVANPFVLGISLTGAGFRARSLFISNPQIEAELHSTASRGHPCPTPDVIGDRLGRLALNLWLSESVGERRPRREGHGQRKRPVTRIIPDNHRVEASSEVTARPRLFHSMFSFHGPVRHALEQRRASMPWRNQPS